MTQQPWRACKTFEYVWQDMIGGRAPIFDQDDVSRMIIKAHDAGMDAETTRQCSPVKQGHLRLGRRPFHWHRNVSTSA
jgi:hypothetical protein